MPLRARRKGLMQRQIINHLNELLITHAFCIKSVHKSITTDRNGTNISLIRLISGVCYFSSHAKSHDRRIISVTLCRHNALTDGTYIFTVPIVEQL